MPVRCSCDSVPVNPLSASLITVSKFVASQRCRKLILTNSWKQGEVLFMATPKVLKNEKVKKVLDKNDEIVAKSVEIGQELSEKAMEYNRDIWLAGLGAFASAREESNELFTKLVKSGEKFEKRYKKTVNERSDSALKAVNSFLGKIPSPSEKIEDVFDSRVARALKRLGVVPTISALKTLNEQVETLTARIEELVDTSEDNAKKAPAKRSTATKRKTVTGKTATKTTAKKPASRATSGKKSVTRKAVAKKPAATKPATRKAVSRKSAAPKAVTSVATTSQASPLSTSTAAAQPAVKQAELAVTAPSLARQSDTTITSE